MVLALKFMDAASSQSYRDLFVESVGRSRASAIVELGIAVVGRRRRLSTVKPSAHCGSWRLARDTQGFGSSLASMQLRKLNGVARRTRTRSLPPMWLNRSMTGGAVGVMKSVEMTLMTMVGCRRAGVLEGRSCTRLERGRIAWGV